MLTWNTVGDIFTTERDNTKRNFIKGGPENVRNNQRRPDRTEDQRAASPEENVDGTNGENAGDQLQRDQHVRERRKNSAG